MSGPPSPIQIADPVASAAAEAGASRTMADSSSPSLDETMNTTISFNATMMSDDYSEDTILQGESILEDMQRAAAATAAQAEQASEISSSVSAILPPQQHVNSAMDDEPTILSEDDESLLLPSIKQQNTNKRSVSFTVQNAEESDVTDEDDSLEDAAKSKQLLLQHVRKEQANAAQTGFVALPAVISYCQEDVAFAQRIRAYYPSLVFRDETEEFAHHAAEFRFCVLSSPYSTRPGTAEVASMAAELGRLVVFRIEESVSDMPEEWQSLCAHFDYCFSAFTPELFTKSLPLADTYILDKVSKENDEYAAVVQIDEYIVLEELGHGAQGVVYRAEHETTREVVAIKELRNMAGKISAEAKTEIAVMKRLKHPNVARLIKVFQPAPEVSTSLFLVLEYIPGGSLMTDSEVWKGGVEPLSPDRAQKVFQQLVRGISYLHYMGVLHRDIKPSNILGDRDHGIVKMSDFGVSSFTKAHKSARVLGEDDIICVGSCGTPAFLPPEASGGGFDVVYHGRPADVWSLGVTFYVLLCGSLPFRGQDRQSTSRLICEQKLKIPSHVPAPAKELIQKMLEKDPEKRATLIWVLHHPWIDAANWKAEVSEQDLSGPGTVSTSDLQASLSMPQSLRKTMKKRSHSFLKLSSSFMRTMMPSPPAMIRPLSMSGLKDKQQQEEKPPKQQLSDWELFWDDIAEKFQELACACGGGDRAAPKKHGDDLKKL